MRENLASLNVICKGKVLNRNGVPLLFYWDGKEEIIDDLQNSEDFKQWLEAENVLNNMEDYLNSHVGLFYFRSHDEDYHELIINIQDLFEFNSLNYLKEDILSECTYYLFNKAFPNREIGIQIFDNPVDQSNAYIKAILKKYEGKITNQTCQMAIRGYIQERYPDFKHLEDFMEYLNTVIFN